VIDRVTTNNKHPKYPKYTHTHTHTHTHSEQICNRSCSNKTHTAPPWVGSRSPVPMVGIRSPIGLVVGSCTSHPGVLGSIPKREEPGKTGRKVETPLVGMRMGAEHEDRQIMKSLRKCLVESESGLFL
jgi:hypothetical protein